MKLSIKYVIKFVKVVTIVNKLAACTATICRSSIVLPLYRNYYFPQILIF